MKVLIVKTSSLGDIIHSLPAINDAIIMRPNIQFDWLVETAFKDIPELHPAVNQVIPIGLRSWRKHWIKSFKNKEIKHCMKDLKQTNYDLIIDLQGLIKSALPAFIAKGPVYGFDQKSIKESIASYTYQQKFTVSKSQHAITRNRQLMAQALKYQIPKKQIDYGLKVKAKPLSEQPYFIFLHGTTWQTKFWPETYWIDLLKLAKKATYPVFLPRHDKADEDRAKRLIAAAEYGTLMVKSSLLQMAEGIAGAKAVVGLDSGLAHLTAALDIPAITLYGPTDTALTGAIGTKQRNLQSEFGCSPCFKKECPIADKKHIYPPCFQFLPAKTVWLALQNQIHQQKNEQ